MYKIYPKTLFVGQNIIYLPTCQSTNDETLQFLADGTAYEGDMVVTDGQTQGRGQRGNQWIAQSGQNLTFSLVLQPTFLLASEQFWLNMAVSLAVYDSLSPFIPAGLRIKWPNDIYVNDRKMGGILIENALQGYNLAHSVVGIGLNINQTQLGYPTATSLLRKLGSEADFVVVDLPPSLSPSSASILGASHHLALVVNPLPACLKLGNSILEGIRLCQTTPTSIGSVVVRLTSEGTPTSPAEIEAEMGVSILAIVPPAPELATQGERTRLPLVQSDPLSMVAEGFTTLAHRFPRQTSRPRR